MKIPNKNKEKKDKVKKKEILKPKKEQVLVVAQEIRFARLLSGNEKKSRDKVLKTLKKWLLNCLEKKYEFKEDDFVRMWKGLFYAVWMSDKPLIQEELCESISAILDLFPLEQLKYALLMYKAGLRVLATEWYGVDHHRMDKFLMLVRRYLRASLRCLLRSQWSLSSCIMYADIISGTDGIFALKTPRYARNATSMLLHFIDCYLEEIAKVSSGDIPAGSLAELLRPLCAYMCGGPSAALCAAARRLLTALLRQSARGIQYRHATSAWQKMGCPAGGPEALELVSDDDDEEDGDQNGEVTDDDDDDDTSSKPLDPRAGRVNVELALLPVPASLLADMLRDMLATATSKAHKRVRICLQRFEQLSRDEYPLPIQSHFEQDSPPPAAKPNKVAHSLHALDKKLVMQSDELALRGLSRKHRKRLLAKSRSGMSIVDDVITVKQKISNATNGSWQVESTDPELNQPKQDGSNKENKKRKRDAKDEGQKKKQRVDRINGDVTEKRQKTDIKRDDSVKNKSKLDKNNKEQIKLSSNNDKVTKMKENGNIKDKNNKKVVVNKSVSKDINKKENKTPEKKVLNIKNNSETPKAHNKKENNLKSPKSPSILTNKVKKFQKQTTKDTSPNKSFDTPKKVKFVLKNNSMQAPIDYYKSIRQSPDIPFDGSKRPCKTNLKPSTPSPINPFFKKKLKLKY